MRTPPPPPGGRPGAFPGAGTLAALSFVSIWATFILLSRFALGGSFTVAELLFLRLAPAALVLAPVMIRKGVIPKGQSWPRALTIMLGAGIGFPAVVIAGLQVAPASDAGPLAPGTLPFWTALATAVMMGERPGPRRLFGLGLIFVGALLVGVWGAVSGAEPGAWRGHIGFVTAAALWAVYTVVFRQSGLSPLHAAAIGMFWSTVFGLPILLWIGLPFDGAAPVEIAVMGLLQGVLISVVALLAYGYAVQVIGASEAGAFGALTPILTLLGGVFLLDEPFGPAKVAGVCLVAAGVLFASGVFSRRAPAPEEAARETRLRRRRRAGRTGPGAR
ncbi:MAG: DMT family transporter [Pseudomonadota bacterium]